MRTESGAALGEGVLCVELAPIGESALPQRDVIMLLDASGSMMAEWAAVAREAAVIVDALPAGITFSAMAFSDSTPLILDRVVLGTAAERVPLKQALTSFVPPFAGTRMGLAVFRTKNLLMANREPRTPSLLTGPSAEELKPPPVIFLATDGRSMDCVDLEGLQEAIPHVTLHVTAYTPSPDASVLGHLAAATGGSYLYCPTANAAGADAELADGRARQIMGAHATPVKYATLQLQDATSGALLPTPRFMDLGRPLRLFPFGQMRLPFALPSAAKFVMEAHCLDDTILSCEITWDPASPPLRTEEALNDIGKARIAEAARAVVRGERQAFSNLLQQVRAESQAATQGHDNALMTATAMTLRLAEEMSVQTLSAPSEMPHLAARMTSCSQGGSTSGGDPEHVARLAFDIGQSLSQADPAQPLLPPQPPQLSIENGSPKRRRTEE